MEAKALKKYIRSSPRKMRLVIDMVRGKSVDEAFTLLRFSTKLAARDAELVLRSAVANLSNKVNGKDDNIYIKTAYVDQGPTAKRIRPAPMGRAYRVRKRSNHLTIVVSNQVKK